MDFSALTNLFSGVDATGFQELLVAFARSLANFDIKVDMNSYISTVENLLTVFSPIWNPIWQWVTTLLEEYVGF